MNKYENNAYFWQKIDTICFSNSFVLLRSRNEAHSEFPNLIYPVDYGYLQDTLSASQGINVYRGSEKSSTVQAIVIAADILKKDVEVKIILGCTEQEEEDILRFLNQTDLQKAVLIRRGNDIPSWGITD